MAEEKEKPAKIVIAESEKYDPKDPENIEEILKAFLAKTECKNKLEALRFIRARKYDVDAAATMWQAAKKWRDENKIDEMKEEPKGSELIRKILPEYTQGFAKDGSPLFVGLWGKINFHQMAKRVKRPDYAQHHIWNIERALRFRCAEGAKLLSKPEGQSMTCIIDLKGMTWECRRFLPFFKHVMGIDTAYYPETLGRTLIVNAPSIFPVIWGVVKGWLDPYTVSKISIYNDLPLEEIYKIAEKAQLPEEVGGEIKGCFTGVATDEDLAKEDLKQIENIKKRLKMEEKKVAAGTKFTIEHIVEEKDFDKKSNPTGMIDVEYFFQTATYEIKFTVEFTPAGASDKELLVRNDSHNSHEIPVIGGVTVNKPGKIEFVWDNSYSWVNAKQLTYGMSRVAMEEVTTFGEE